MLCGSAFTVLQWLQSCWAWLCWHPFSGPCEYRKCQRSWPTAYNQIILQTLEQSWNNLETIWNIYEYMKIYFFNVLECKFNFLRLSEYISLSPSLTSNLDQLSTSLPSILRCQNQVQRLLSPRPHTYRSKNISTILIMKTNISKLHRTSQDHANSWNSSWHILLPLAMPCLSLGNSPRGSSASLGTAAPNKARYLGDASASICWHGLSCYDSAMILLWFC